MKKRILSCLMALALCLTLLPTAALAEGTEGTAQTSPAVEKSTDPANGEAKRENQPAETKQENQPAEQGEQQENSASKQDGAVADVQAMIDALPDAAELDGMDDEEAMAVYEAFQAACEAYYETLTEEQQAQLKNTEKLAALSDWFSQPETLAESGYIYPDTVDAEGNIIRHTGWSRTGPIYEGSDRDAAFTDDKFYVIEKDTSVTIQGNLTVGGIGALILCQGATLTVKGALICNGNYSIYGQSDKGNNAGRLVIENSKGGGAAIRLADDATGTPTLHIDSGEVTINGGNSGKLVEGVKLYSEKKIHAATLGAEKVSPDAWSNNTLIEGTSLVLAYCDHVHATYRPSGTTQHTKHCPDCGFVGTPVSCTFDGNGGYDQGGENGHYAKCVCGNAATTTTAHNMETTWTDDGLWHTSMCGICGYIPAGSDKEQHKYDRETGVCTVCQFKPVAIVDKVNADYCYAKVNDALEEAVTHDDPTVMLKTEATNSTDKTIDSHVSFDYDGKSVALAMNGYSLETSKSAPITVENGTLTVTGDATLVQNGKHELAVPAVCVTGGTLIFEGKLTASGKPAVEVTNGTLRLKEGDALNGGVSVEGSTTYANVNALLGENLAFAKAGETSTIVKGDVTSISGDVTVVAHTHSFTLNSGKYACACGYTCPHNDFKDGKCTICGNGCAHTNVDENGVCENCKTQMAVKSETGGTVTYTTDFKSAMRNATNGTKITLLADVSIPQRTGISGDDTTVTLDLNGHKITSGWLDVGDKDTNGTYTACTLKIIGKGSYEPPMYGGIITVDVKATLDLSEWEGGTISEISISDNSDVEKDNPNAREAAVIVGPKAGTIGELSFGNNQLEKLTKTKLSGGSFNQIWAANHVPVKLGELLVSGYALQHDDGSYEKYTTTLQNESIYNVKVVKCPHADAKDGTCLYCGKTGIAAMVGSKTYDNVGTAVSEWLDGSVQGTLKLFADYGEGFDAKALDLSSASAEWLTIDLNGHTFYQNCKNNINLSGGKRLTITDSKEKTGSQGAFGPIDADRGTLTLESGHLQGLKVFSGSEPTILLKGGKVTGISCPVPIFNLLPNGYALMDSSGLPVDPTITIDDFETYTVKDSTNLDISSQKEGSAAMGSDTIPLALSLKTGDGTIGLMSFEWYIVKENGTTQKLAASKDDVTPGADGVYTCNAANMTVGPNGWTDLIVGETYNVLCVVTGKTSDGTSSKWQTPMRGYKLTVTKIDLANAEVTISDWPKDGKVSFSPSSSAASVLIIFDNSVSNRITVKANGTEGVLTDRDYTYDGATATQVGKYTLTITATDSCANYTGSKTFNWEVVPYALPAPVFEGNQKYTKIYDGTTFLPEGYKFQALFPDKGPGSSEVDWRKDENNYEVNSAEFVSPDAGENKPINQTITLKNKNFVFAPTINIVGVTATDNTITYKNFTLSEAYPTLGTTFNIKKATVPDFDKAVTLEVINDLENTYTIDLPALPTLESPRTYGDITYTVASQSLEHGYATLGQPTVKQVDGKYQLCLTVPAVKYDQETSIGTILVKVTTTNYNDVVLTVNLQAVNKRKLGMFVSVATDPVVYGMTLGDIKLSAEATDGGQVIPGTIAWEDPLTTVPAAGQATYRWTFTPDDTMHYLTASNTIHFSVDKATPTGAPTYTAITAGGKTLSDAALTANAGWPSGTVRWVDKDGKPLPASTQVQANTEYTWSFTPADAANYNGASGSVTLYAVTSGGGGSSSASKTSTTTNADGSVTKTETKKDGTKVETTTGKDGSVSKTTTNPNGSSVTENKAADGSTGTVKTDKNGQTTAETKVSAKAVEDAKKNGEAVKAPVEVKASRNSSTAPTVSIELPKGAGETKVEIPISNATPGTVAVIVHPDGTEEIMKDSIPTEDGIQLTINGGATVKIVDNSKDFADTQNHWAKDAIDFVSARGLVNGMSATIYAPNNSTTRAQLWTILARQADADLAGGANWYEKAQLWSKDKGISDGTNPNGTINRAQMVTMLWRTMGQPAAGGSASFADVPADSYYAQAVAWAIENGITAGVGGGRFDPNSTCTRAQIAAFLARSMK